MARNKNEDSSRTFGISLEHAVRELRTDVQTAQAYIESELEPVWDTAERYYNGECDIPIVEGRAAVTKTEFRDAVRNSMPSIMRTLYHARTPVQYRPTSIQHAQWVDQQAEYVFQIFNDSDGYTQLYTAILEALKLRLGILKVFWIEEPIPTWHEYTKIPFTFIESLIRDPDFEVVDYEKASDSGELEVWNVSGRRTYENGKICIEAVPNYEFFISRNATSIDHALETGVHGHHTSMSVATAKEMGWDYDDWDSIDAPDPEQERHTSSSTSRRRYVKEALQNHTSKDLNNRIIAIREVYRKYDLKGLGYPQTYKFILAGSAHTYIHHEEVEDSPFACVVPIPRPFTMHGDSLFDLTVNEQDASTSIWRGAIDNVHLANNPRIAADPDLTSFDDLENPSNGPIRKRRGDTLQDVTVPFTGQGNLALLQYADQEVQNKVGITKAAQGLDPDAMQSTDKDAVLNTIMTSEGQTELMVRNIIETGLIRVFKLLLRASIAHPSPRSMMNVKGTYLPVSHMMFDPDATAIPAVGLGTASPMQKQAILTMVRQDQQALLDKYGPNNPFTSYAQLYNTTEDLLNANGVHNVSRYYNVVTPEAEKRWAEAEAAKRAEMEREAKQNMPLDPGRAHVMAETAKAKQRAMEDANKSSLTASRLQLEALSKREEADLKRDQMAQDRVIRLAEIQADERNAQIKEEQAGDNTNASTGTQRSGKKGD